jgi:hypothetical protein
VRTAIRRSAVEMGKNMGPRFSDGDEHRTNKVGSTRTKSLNEVICLRDALEDKTRTQSIVNGVIKLWLVHASANVGEATQRRSSMPPRRRRASRQRSVRS